MYQRQLRGLIMDNKLWFKAYDAFDKWVGINVSRKTNTSDKMKWCHGYVYALEQLEKLNATHKEN
jgi:hypothetical protein